MNFRISDTFSASLTRLSGDEQKAVKTTAFDLQMNPASPGMQFHDLERAKDPNFRSVRVSRDIRLIVHVTASSLLLCYVDHHDAAYRWAERRKLETHPRTGAAQLVEIRETVREIEVPIYVPAEVTSAPEPPKPPLFAHLSDDELLGYGVPVEWLEAVRQANEDSLLEIAEHLPGEAAEALLNLATGVRPPVAVPVPAEVDPFEHPDAKRRFRVMTNVEELERALDYPWEKWTVFLHPAQRDLVERNFNGPARVSGSAGTGKTIVALHRAVFLARNHPDARVLLTTFSDTLSNALKARLKLLIGNEPRVGERLEVCALNSLGQRLSESSLGKPSIASEDDLQQIFEQSIASVDGLKFGAHFLLSEWNEIVDAWQLETWEAYRDVQRLGRKTRLPEKQRAILWSVFNEVRLGLKERNLITHAMMFSQLASQFDQSKRHPYDFIVIDEAQDISVPQLRFLAALGAGRPNSLFFAGDLGQRIFQPPFSWKELGVDIRGRSSALRINYRTSHQIRRQADRLLPPEISDVDGNIEKRRGTVSIFNGPNPTVKVFETEEQEITAVAEWLKNLKEEQFQPHEVGLFVRSLAQVNRAKRAVRTAGLKFVELDENFATKTGAVAICTMHLAKGLEFRAVAVIACDDEVIPLQERIEAVTDNSDLEEVYNTERHLLYVACTRVRDRLFVTSTEPSSEFLDDLHG